MRELPFVSVVTPVYNGGRFIAECIESVLGQTHRNFEYVILDNASTDDTAAIIARYAEQDDRIRIARNDETLWIIDNWNRALELISPDSQYCRILCADDTMQADCLEKMVAVGERNPSVAIVGSLRSRAGQVECGGLPRDRELFDGGYIVRRFLRQEVFALAPTCGLVRSNLIRERRPFFPAGMLHADLAGYLAVLSAPRDFGFVHEALSFSRVHEGSMTATVADRRQTMFAEWLQMLRRYGPRVFTAQELESIQETFLRRYYRLIVRAYVTRREREYLDYHLTALREAGRAPSATDLCAAVGAEIAQSLAHPEKLYRHVRAAVTYRQGRPAG